MSRTVPAEWSPHRAMWVGFPSDAELWEEDLAAAQAEVAALACALAGPGAERVRLLVGGAPAETAARALLDAAAHGGAVEIVRGLFGDVWVRDTGPIFVHDDERALAVSFRFNGWGGKYVLEGDADVAQQLAAAGGTPLETHDVVLEGGAVDHDGFGSVLTTRQCLLNPNRNADWTQETAEATLAASLGARRVVWLDQGLANDHTDGHVDNLARFVAPGVVACPVAEDRDDPNAEVYEAAARALAAGRTARDRAIEVVRLASPGRIEDASGALLPGSHMNFVIANGAVVAPTYAAPRDGDRAARLALETLQSLFPERAVIGLPARALLTGGGAFHCVTQQEPG